MHPSFARHYLHVHLTAAVSQQRLLEQSQLPSCLWADYLLLHSTRIATETMLVKVSCDMQHTLKVSLAD